MNSKTGIKKIGRKTSHRKALVLNLLNDLIIYEHLTTTKVKAKIVVKEMDHLMAKARKWSENKYNLERMLMKELRNTNSCKKVTEVLLKRFKENKTGLVKTYQLENRKGDNAEVLKLILLGYEYKDIGKKVKAKKSVKSEGTGEKNETKTPGTQFVGPQSKDTKQSQYIAESNLTKPASRSGI